MAGGPIGAGHAAGAMANLDPHFARKAIGVITGLVLGALGLGTLLDQPVGEVTVTRENFAAAQQRDTRLHYVRLPFGRHRATLEVGQLDEYGTFVGCSKVVEDRNGNCTIDYYFGEEIRWGAGKCSSENRAYRLTQSEIEETLRSMTVLAEREYKNQP